MPSHSTRPSHIEERDTNITHEKQPLASPSVVRTTQRTTNTLSHNARLGDAEERNANIVRNKRPVASPGVVQTTHRIPNVSHLNTRPRYAEERDDNSTQNKQLPESPGVVQTAQGAHNASYHRLSYADARDVSGLRDKQLLASFNVEYEPQRRDARDCTTLYNEECNDNLVQDRRVLASLAVEKQKPQTKLKEMRHENQEHRVPSDVTADKKRKVDADRDWAEDANEILLPKTARIANGENMCPSPMHQQSQATRVTLTS